MVVRFIDCRTTDYMVVKESRFENIILPKQSDFVTIEMKEYLVKHIEYNYDNGVITVKLM